MFASGPVVEKMFKALPGSFNLLEEGLPRRKTTEMCLPKETISEPVLDQINENRILYQSWNMMQQNN